MKLETTVEERALWADEVMHFERDILKRASARGDVTDRTKRLLLDHDALTARLSEAEHSLAEMREALSRLTDAAEGHEASQDGATDTRVGLTQPITVAEGQALVDALAQARQALAGRGA